MKCIREGVGCSFKESKKVSLVCNPMQEIKEIFNYVFAFIVFHHKLTPISRQTSSSEEITN